MSEHIIKKDYSKWSIGDIDSHGYKISQIYTAVENFIIYGTESGVLNYDSIGTEDYTEKLSVLSKEISIINALKTEKNLRFINKQVAIAWRDCFYGDNETAKAILTNLIDQLVADGKRIYILSLVFTFLASLGLSLLMIQLFKFHSVKDELILINKVAILGAFGGLISVLIKMRDLILDPQSKIINIFSGISRIIIAIAASIIFYLAFKADILLSFTKKSLNSDNEVYLILLISFFMGFSERAIPDFSNKINGLINEK